MSRTQRLSQPEDFGKYQLVARLATGRLGEVYKAKSHGVEGFEKILVVKALNPALAGIPGLVDIVVDEAKRAVALSHANVAQVYDLGQTDGGHFYLASEYIAGFDLARTHKVAGEVGEKIPQELAIFIASEVAKGLDYAHRRKDYNFNTLNILHRDLIPSNVMLSFDGEVKITDFGISKALELVSAVDAEDIVRRYQYLAPEVARGEQHTRQSDLFSLGLLLYEMLAGAHPYQQAAERLRAAGGARAQQEFMRCVQHAAIPPLTSFGPISRKLQQIVESMLVPDPAGRVAHSGQIYEELIGYLFGNNLRADSRLLAQFIQAMRRHEQRLLPQVEPAEVGIDEISFSELTGAFSEAEVLEGISGAVMPPAPDLPQVSSPTHADLPSARFQELLASPKGAENIGEDGFPELPGAFHKHFLAARAGQGKAVLVSGQFGMGREYLSDQLVQALGQRGNTQAFGIQPTGDDIYRPLGVITDLILSCLKDTLSGQADPHHAALRLLKGIDGVEQEALLTLASLWDLEPMPRLDYERRRAHFSALFSALMKDFSRSGPVVLVIDRVERVDSLSLDVLRDFVALIDTLPVMLVMTTHSDEATRATFDQGNPENLETLRIVGSSEPEISALRELTASAAEILLLLTICGQPMSQWDFSQILGLPSDRLMQALRELADSGAVRLPQPGIFLASWAQLDMWVGNNFELHQVTEAGRALARYYQHRVIRGEIDRLTPTLIRLHAISGDRRMMLSRAGAYSRWLESGGWTGIALDFYRHVADLLAEYSLGSPQARIDYMLLRAELALELSRLDDARESLEPVAALSESLRNEHGIIRGQLLLGQMAMQQDDLDEAYTCFRRAARLASRLNDPDLLARSRLALAGWYQRYGDPLASKEHLDGALNLFSRWGTYRMDLRSRSMLLQRAVEMWADRGMVSRARQISMELRRLAQVCELNAVECRADWAEARVLNEMGEYQRALELLQRAESDARSGDLVALRVELNREKAAAALATGEFERALKVTQELAELAEKYQDLYSLQRAGDLAAIARCMLGEELHEAVEHLQMSLQRAQARAIPLDIYLSHSALQTAFEALGREDLARGHRLSAEKLREWMRFHPPGQKFSAAKSISEPDAGAA